MGGFVGLAVDFAVGFLLGCCVGVIVGFLLGCCVGVIVGFLLGFCVGNHVKLSVGERLDEGFCVGIEGIGEKEGVGNRVGIRVLLISVVATVGLIVGNLESEVGDCDVSESKLLFEFGVEPINIGTNNKKNTPKNVHRAAIGRHPEKLLIFL